MGKRGMNSRKAAGTGSIRKKTVCRNGKTYEYWEGRCTVGYDPGTGRQIQRSITGKTQKEVSQALRKMTMEVDEGTYRAPSELTVGQWLDTWSEEYLTNVKQSTAFVYRENIRLYLKPGLGAIKLESLSPPVIQRFYNTLGRSGAKGTSLSAKTIKNIHGVLHQALKQAVAVGYLRVNPSDACTLPKVIHRQIKPLEEEQVRKFLMAIQGHRHELLYKVALFTGMREGELLGLMWDCVDFEHGTIRVDKQLQRHREKGGGYYLCPTKNSKARLIAAAPCNGAVEKAETGADSAAPGGGAWVAGYWAGLHQ